LGEPRKQLRAAVALLAENPAIKVEAVSPLYETPPWGNPDQPRFLNAAVRIDTSLSAHELLSAVLEVERRLGRERLERWGPRTIDIDILLFGSVHVVEPGLHIPHARLPERAFALLPLLSVMPDATIFGRRASDWLTNIDASGIRLVADESWAKQLTRA
jgi:2-amino-4-hydroxy-6-hydroxymethyldihydropteridine diphosphokinase